MKNITILFFLFCVCGCTSLDADKVNTWVTDSHYARYQEKINALEKNYLEEKITYSRFLEKKKELDEQYDFEVKEREQRMHE